MKLTSYDYANLIQRIAHKRHGVFLGKTQTQKILFYIFGIHYALCGELLFDDDAPRAWPFGPVFPIVHKRIKEDAIAPIDVDALPLLRSKPKEVDLCVRAVDAMYKFGAGGLTRWSHQYGSPWYQTIYPDIDAPQSPWNTPIALNLIRDYFKQPKHWLTNESEYN